MLSLGNCFYDELRAFDALKRQLERPAEERSTAWPSAIDGLAVSLTHEGGADGQPRAATAGGELVTQNPKTIRRCRCACAGDASRR